MRVAAGIRARGPILNRSDNAEDPRARCIAVNTESVWPIQPGQRLRLRMARVTRLSSLIHNVVLLRRVSRIRNPSVPVENADLLNSRFGRHRLNRAVQSFSIIAEHVVGSTLLDDVADPLGREQRVLLQMLPMQLDVEISQESENQNHGPEQEYVQLRAQGLRRPQQAGSSWFSLRHAPRPASLEGSLHAPWGRQARGRPSERLANTAPLR